MKRRDFVREALVSLAVSPLVVGEASRLADLPPGWRPPEEPWLSHVVTWYCPCDLCCGTWRNGELIKPASGITSRGHPPIEGQTVAVDPTVWRYGTLLQIEGLGVRIASDCGQAIKGQHLDIFVESHEVALRRGRQRLLARKFNP